MVLVAATATAEGEVQPGRRRSRRPTAVELLELTPRTQAWERAAARQTAGELGEAERLYRRVLACHSKMLGPKHPHTFLAMFNLAATMAARGDYAGAENYARLSLEGYTQFNLADDVREGIQQLGVILRELDREEEAEEIAGHAGFYWFCGKLMKARS